MTPQEIRELLPLYALGVLTPDEESAIESAVARDATLAAELVSYRDAATAMIEPVVPSPETKTRLMASIGEGRFEKFSAGMAKLFDVSVDRAREILGLVDRSASWEAAMPGIGLVHFGGGPAYAAADCGFVRLAEGAAFPLHKHLGEEVSLILSGRLQAVDEQGNERILVEGDELVQAHGSEHHLIAIGGECVFAARAMNGIEIGGAPARPSKPEH
ncbi:MAG: cupin domain-containing protein [Deltaproteobacteria bacterium]|nr:cupin domain-containing protein [Deltaproteobacteria bacterium]